MDSLYPVGPQTIPADLTKPTKSYRQHAWLALCSLVLFVVLYLALTGWFAWTAYRVIHEAMIGGDNVFFLYIIGGSSAFLSLFMVKALFFIKRGGDTGAVEVTAAEQPELFQFLFRLADDAGAPRPNRVFLSARVNAAVFYDLSILNLLFPSRKNLEIGLALVNVLTLSEMKAVLAHEFGHFAQRSMAIGSWVYIAQQIALHIIAKRDALDKFLKFLSNIDLRVAWFGWLLSLIVWSIRSLMDTLLRMVVLAQRALSRQMEFQADLVAVSLTGSDELVHALHKLNAADEAWGRSLNFANSELQQGRLPSDLFVVQTKIIEKVAKILGDDSYGRVPPMPATAPEARRIFKSSFANPPQMWSTHPISADREENAKQQYLPAPHDTRSAWLLFKNPADVKQKVISNLIGATEAQPSSEEQTLQSLEKQYAHLRYDPRYHGAYLGRSLTRHAKNPDELYDKTRKPHDVIQALNGLYYPELASDFAELRELAEERNTLEALHNKVFKATGGRIVHRGRDISRRDLPDCIKEVSLEEDAVRQRIIAHDTQCRSVHIAAAGLLGNGWQPYLLGLIHVLHYAEHTLADLNDAKGQLANVYAVVTADGKVSSRELKRLLVACNSLHAVLANIYEQQSSITLDALLCERMEIASWPDRLEEFRLPCATAKNINDWIGAIDGWVNSTAGALNDLATNALELLLWTEDAVARHVRENTAIEPAGSPSRVPSSYPTLLPEQQRERQQRLGLWDRFQTADGIAPAFTRFLVAASIVGAVLGFGNFAGTTSELTVYNGLDVQVQVNAGDQKLAVAPFSSDSMDVAFGETPQVSTWTSTGTLIEQFTPELTGHAQHYVYNVAGASPLVEWTAVYGSAQEVPPSFLDAPRWTTSSADIFFADPPENVKTKSGGATRSVLTGAGQRSPEETLELIQNASVRKQVIAAHAKWDSDKGKYTAAWKALAAEQ